jgi:hypothetical protein
VSWSPEGEPSIVLRQPPSQHWDSPWFSADSGRFAGPLPMRIPHAHSPLRGSRSIGDTAQMSLLPELDEEQRSTDDDGAAR